MDSKRSRGAIRLPATTNIKIGLLAASVLSVIGILIYAHRLTDELKIREQRIAQLTADALNYFQNTDDFDAKLYLKVVEYIRNSGVPMVISDKDDLPVTDTVNFKSFNINIPLDTALSQSERKTFLQKEMRRMDGTYKPIIITYTDSIGKKSVTNYIHYGDSIILSKIEELPLIQLLLGLVVVVIGICSSYQKGNQCMLFFIFLYNNLFLSFL